MTAAEAVLLRQAGWQASALVAAGVFQPQDWEDLRQELVLDCLRRAPRFDPRRGEWSGFCRGVMRHQASVLVQRQRLLQQREVLIDDQPQTDGGDDPESRYNGSNHVALDTAIAVRTVLARLPNHLRQVALLLAEMPVMAVCAHLGRSRSRVHQLTVQLRIVFIDAGAAPGSKPGAARGRTARPLSPGATA